ncbi:MAG TPA: SBBP repeat-containing protein [Thermoanaerobaculia bacterium]|nr:SBBP repeat-containing protein [Thermoanaerobaculia bacterium]
MVETPSLAWSTYLGGTDLDSARGVALDSEGNAYIVGLTYSPDFPLASPGRTQFQRNEAFVVKVAPDGTVLFSTFLGGSSGEWAEDVVVAGGTLYVTGFTGSADFPLVDPLPASQRRGGSDAFVTRMSLDGTSILWSTTLGGTLGEHPFAIDVRADGSVYLAGTTSSSDFPTVNPAQSSFAGGLTDGFAAKINPVGPTLVWSTYFGGSAFERIEDLAVDSTGKAYVVGRAESADLPTRMARQPDRRGPEDGFLAGFGSQGELLVSTYLGGLGSDAANGVAVDGAGFLYVGGSTSSTDLPTTPGVFQRKKAGPGNAFVARLGPLAGSVVWWTYLGGSASDSVTDLEIDSTGHVYVAGVAQSTDFPLRHPVDSECAPAWGTFCGGEAFMAKLSPGGGGLLFSTYLGGSTNPTGDGQTPLEIGEGIAVGLGGEVAIAGETFSTDFPTVNAFQPTYPGAGSRDGFAALMVGLPASGPPVCSAAFASPSAIWPPDRRQVRITIGGVTDPVGDPVTLKVTRILQDELFTARMPDAGGLGTAKPWVRADRMDSGDGRVYHLFFEATNPAGGRCTGEVRVCVPLQSGGTCGDGGARIDSTLPR